MILGLIILFTAISISSVSAFYSISGLSSIFTGSFYPIVLMGIVLEFGKLSSVAFLHKYWSQIKFVKYYLSLIIFVLMLINAMGIFGYLSKAHIEQEVFNSSQTQTIEIVKNQVQNEEDDIKDIDKQLNLIDNALDKLTQTGRAATALIQIQAQKKSKDILQNTKTQHQIKLQQLKEKEVEQNLNNQKIEADFGPLKYIADAIYTNPTNLNLEHVVVWLIIVIIFVFDPLALILLNCSLFIFDRIGSKKIYYDNMSALEINNKSIIGEQ